MTNACCDQSQKNILKNLDDAITELQVTTSTASDTKPTDTEVIHLSEALNRVLSKDIHSSINVPPADNSAVDGYALNLEDYPANSELLISQRIPAGSAPQPLAKNTAARIFTGAHIPDGANCVVMQENTTLSTDNKNILISEAPTLNQNIRPMGQDIKVGDCILSKGDVLTPQRLGLVASIGIAEIEVFKPLWDE